MAGKIRIKLKRLMITPLSEDEMMKLILTERDETMRRRYTTMLTDAREHADAWNYHTAWKAALKKQPEETLGTVFFISGPENGTVGIGYALRAVHEDMQYAEEALAGLAEWAFSQQDVYHVFIHTEDDQVLSAEVLKEKGFANGEGEWAGLQVCEKAQSVWLPVYICLFFAIGISVGILFRQLIPGTLLGTAAGAGIGRLMDQSERKHREKVMTVLPENG